MKETPSTLQALESELHCLLLRHRHLIQRRKVWMEFLSDFYLLLWETELGDDEAHVSFVLVICRLVDLTNSFSYK